MTKYKVTIETIEPDDEGDCLSVTTRESTVSVSFALATALESHARFEVLELLADAVITHADDSVGNISPAEAAFVDAARQYQKESDA